MYELQQINNRLALVNVNNKRIKPISVNFCSKELQYRCRPQNLAKEILKKALGHKLGHQLRVIDTTAGFGNDAFILAALGCKVDMIERSTIMAQLLEDGLRRAKECAAFTAIINSLALIVGDAITVLEQLPTDEFPDVVYIDPMFPERRKSASVKKAMQALQEIVGENSDSNKLLAAALKVAKQRVIVKRPRLAPVIECDTCPSFSLKGASCRFDVYVL